MSHADYPLPGGLKVFEETDGILLPILLRQLSFQNFFKIQVLGVFESTCGKPAPASEQRGHLMQPNLVTAPLVLEMNHHWKRDLLTITILNQ